MRTSQLLASSFVLIASLSGCAGMQIHDFKAGITLPYSEDCYFVNALSDKEVRYPKAQCDKMKKRALIVLSEDWKILRANFQENCQVEQCKQLVGQFDALFLEIDKNLQLIPWD